MEILAVELSGNFDIFSNGNSEVQATQIDHTRPLMEIIMDIIIHDISMIIYENPCFSMYKDGKIMITYSAGFYRTEISNQYQNKDFDQIKRLQYRQHPEI